ncbi:MAG TPA: hypothetical protein VML55_23855, partial [Planctomycetaceae bacterium]|nr:hypothetical protein [Planctomycetaceae bacterium]
SGGRSRIEIIPRDGEPRRFEFVRFEGRWFPAAWQASWQAELAAAREKLKTELAPAVLEQKKQSLLPALEAFEASLDRLAAAPDGQAFHDLLDRELLPLLSGAAAPPPGVADGSDGSLVPPASSSGSVIVEFGGPLDERTADAVAQALVGICDQPDGIVLPAADGGGTRLTVSPVGDVQAFARRIRFGRVTSIDPGRRTVTVELSESVRPER